MDIIRNTKQCSNSKKGQLFSFVLSTRYDSRYTGWHRQRLIIAKRPVSDQSWCSWCCFQLCSPVQQVLVQLQQRNIRRSGHTGSICVFMNWLIQSRGWRMTLITQETTIVVKLIRSVPVNSTSSSSIRPQLNNGPWSPSLLVSIHVM